MNWKNYISDIPENWIDVSCEYHSLPSFISAKHEDGGYHIWIDLAPRFHVFPFYRHGNVEFISDDLDAVVKWINDNPKTPEQIKSVCLSSATWTKAKE